MKQLSFRRRSGLFLVILTIALYSCRKDLKPITPLSEKPALSLQEAQNWFSYQYNQRNYQRIDNKQSGFSMLLQGGITPDWEKVRSYFLPGREQIMEIPLLTSRNYYYELLTGIERKNVPDYLPADSAGHLIDFARLIMTKDSSGAVHAAILTFIAGKEYLQTHDNLFKANSFLKTDSTFTGLAVLKQFPGGTFIRGYWYEKGIKKGQVIEEDPHNQANAGSRMLACGTYSVPWYYTVCTPVPDTRMECSEYLGGYDLYPIFCDGGGDSSGGNDGGDLPPLNPPNGGGGGIPGGYPEGGNDGKTFKPFPEDVQNYIYNEPFALFHDVPCDSIKQWLAVAGYQPGSSIINKLNGIVATQTAPSGVGGPGFTYEEVTRVQNINDAFSSVVNMDYFSVKVNTLPVINGVRVTPDQFLQYIRKNINGFVNTDFSKFTPYKYGNTDDTNLWNADNPFGAVVSIEIPGTGVLHNDGSVITSYYSSNKWTFTTIHDPMNGEHPVSGNRNFGYTINTDGTYTFYTQGVDRLTDAITTFLNIEPFELPFKTADALWESFQGKIFDFIRGHSGVSIIQPPLTYRPNWQDVKDVLDGKKPLSTLSKLCPD